MLQNPQIADAAVIGRADDEWGEIIVAAVVPRDGTGPSESDVIENCRAHVAGYKKPREVIFLDAIPRNVAGKIDKTALKRRLNGSGG